jgi:hypothetical protein
MEFNYDQAEQMDNMRERLEAEQEKDELAKSKFTDIEMDMLQDYYSTYIADFDEEDPDREIDAFMNWFEYEAYHELLEIINKKNEQR